MAGLTRLNKSGCSSSDDSQGQPAPIGYFSNQIQTRLACMSFESPPSLSLLAPMPCGQSSDYIGLPNAGYDSRTQSNTTSDHSHSPSPTSAGFSNSIAHIPHNDLPHGQHDYIHYPPQLSPSTISFPAQHSLYPINPLALAQDIKQQADGWAYDTHTSEPAFVPNVALVYPPYSPSSSTYPLTHQPQHQATTHARPPSHPPWALAGSLDTTTGIFYRTPAHPRLRTAQACEKCRSRKAKCSGERPTCNRCLTRGLTCGYAKEGRMRGPNKPKNIDASGLSDAEAKGSSQRRESSVTKARGPSNSLNLRLGESGIYGSGASMNNSYQEPVSVTSFESSPISTSPSPLTPGSVYEDDGVLYPEETSCPGVLLPDGAWAMDLGHPGQIFGEGQLDFGRNLPIGGKIGWGNSAG